MMGSALSLCLTSNDVFAVLPDPLAVKMAWLHAEWESSNPIFKQLIQAAFPGSERDLLLKKFITVDTALRRRVDVTFENVRGRFSFWKPRREHGCWHSVQLQRLELNWVAAHVDVLWGTNEVSTIEEL